MAFWSGQKLAEQLPSLISDYSKSRVDCAAYTLRMGRQYYISASEADVDTNKVRALAPGDSVNIPSGQFAILVTEEVVTVPAGVIAFISMKTGLKARGLVNVSGFHVDPGYSARLRFAVFNAGPSTICIPQGEECFLIWYADLDRVDKENIKTASNNHKYAAGIMSNDLASLSGAVKTIQLIAGKVDGLEKTQLWMKIFVGYLSILGTIVTAMTIFLAYEGIRSYLAKAGTAIGAGP